MEKIRTGVDIITDWLWQEKSKGYNLQEAERAARSQFSALASMIDTCIVEMSVNSKQDSEITNSVSMEPTDKIETALVWLEESIPGSRKKIEILLKLGKVESPEPKKETEKPKMQKKKEEK